MTLARPTLPDDTLLALEVWVTASDIQHAWVGDRSMWGETLIEALSEAPERSLDDGVSVAQFIVRRGDDGPYLAIGRGTLGSDELRPLSDLLDYAANACAT